MAGDVGSNPASGGEFELNWLNVEFPCDQRTGYGKKGCACGKGLAGESKKEVSCNLYSPQINWLQCIQCPYQQRYIKNINTGT